MSHVTACVCMQVHCVVCVPTGSHVDVCTAVKHKVHTAHAQHTNVSVRGAGVCDGDA